MHLIKKKIVSDMAELEKEKKEYKKNALKDSQTIIEVYRKEIEALIQKIKESNASKNSIVDAKELIKGSLEEVNRELQTLEKEGKLDNLLNS